MNLKIQKKYYLKWHQLQYFDIKLYELLGIIILYVNGKPLSINNTVSIDIYLDYIKKIIDEALMRLRNIIIRNNGYYYIQLVEHARLYYAGTLWVMLMYGASVSSDIKSLFENEIEEAFNNWQFLLYFENSKILKILNILKIDRNYLKF